MAAAQIAGSETYRAYMGYPANPPPRSGAVMAAHDAGVSVLPLAVLQRHEAWKPEELDLKQMALRLGESAPQMLLRMGGAAGAVAGAGVSLVSGQYENDKRFEALKASFGGLAAELGKTPEQMQREDWDELAKGKPLLQQHLDRIDHEFNIRPRDSVANAGAATAGMAAGAAIGSIVPVAGTFIGGLIGGAAAGFACNAALDSVDERTADNTGVVAIEALSKTHAAGGQVSADDVMRALVLGTPELKQALEASSAEGIRFPLKPAAELSPEETEQRDTLLQGPKARKLMACSGIFADDINTGKMTAETLIRIDPAVLVGDRPVQIMPQQATQAQAAPISDTQIAPDGLADYTDREKAIAAFKAGVQPGFVAREDVRRAQADATEPVRA